MPIASRGSGAYTVSGANNTLNLRWSQIQGTARNDEIVLNKKNIGGWAMINMGAGEDTVTLAAGGDYTLQLIGVETIKTTAAHTTLRLRSDATTSTDGSFEAITAMYGVQNITYTGATGTNSTISLGALDDKVTFSGAATNWIYNKDGHTVYAYDLTTGYRVAVNSDVEIVNFAGTDLTASSVATGKLYLTEDGTSDISGLALQGAPTDVIFTTGNNNLVATAAQLAAITTFDGLAGTDQITLSAAGTFNTTGKTLTSIDSINGSSGADTITVTTAGITTNGNGGADILTGSTGADTIIGGSGADDMTGGGGADTFVLVFGDSSATTAGADEITDFDTANDVIDLAVAGTAANYTEIDGAGYATLAAAVTGALNYSAFDGTVIYAFVYNLNNSGDSYLVMDETAGGASDGAILLTGLATNSGFEFGDII